MIANFNKLFANAYNNATKATNDANAITMYFTPEIQTSILNAANVEVNKINVINIFNNDKKIKNIISLPDIFNFLNENIFAKNVGVDKFYNFFSTILEFTPDKSIKDDMNSIYNNTTDYNINDLTNNKDNAINFAKFTGIILAIKCINRGNHFLSEAVNLLDKDSKMNKSKKIINNICEGYNDAITFYNSINTDNTSFFFKKTIDTDDLIHFSEKFVKFINDTVDKLKNSYTLLENNIAHLKENNDENIKKPDKISNILDINNSLTYNEYIKKYEFDNSKNNYTTFLTEFELKSYDINNFSIDVKKKMTDCNKISSNHKKEITQIINKISSDASSTFKSLFGKNINDSKTIGSDVYNPINNDSELHAIYRQTSPGNVFGGVKIKDTQHFKDVKTCSEQVQKNIIDPIHEYIEKLKTIIDDLDGKYNAFANCVFCNNIYYAEIAFMNYYYANNIAEVIVNATSKVAEGSTIDADSIKTNISDGIDNMITNYKSNEISIKKTTRSNIGNKVEQVSGKIHNFSEKINKFIESMNEYSSTITELNNSIEPLVEATTELTKDVEVAKSLANNFKDLAIKFNEYVNTNFAVKGGAKTRFVNKYKCKNQKVSSIRKIKKLCVRSNTITMKKKYLKRRTQ